MNPKFSIIIPVYNVASYLRDCLDSVLAQKYTDWEAICVDDGSTDGSGAILDEYAARDSRFRVIHQANTGVSTARNAALNIVCGEWISFVDSDDWLKDNYLEEFVIAEDKADVNFFDVNFNYSSGVIKSICIDSHGGVEGQDKNDLIRTLLRNDSGVNSLGYTWNKFFNGDLIRNNGLRFIEGLSCSEDELFTFDALRCSHSIASKPLSGYCYRWTNSGLTSKRLYSRRKLVLGLVDIANKTNDSELKSIILCRAIQFFGYASARFLTRSDFALIDELFQKVSDNVVGRFKVVYRYLSMLGDTPRRLFLRAYFASGRFPAVSI